MTYVGCGEEIKLLFLPFPMHYLHYTTLITHSDFPTFLSTLLLFRADIWTMNKKHKYNSSFNGPVFLLSSKLSLT